MKTSLKNNWPVKLASFLAALAIWFLIKQHIGEDPTARFSGYQAEGEKFRSQLGQIGADQIKVQQLLEQAGELQKSINETLLNNAPKAVPVEQTPPSPEKDSTKKSESSTPSNP